MAHAEAHANAECKRYTVDRMMIEIEAYCYCTVITSDQP
jgi:hypothetical protein